MLAGLPVSLLVLLVVSQLDAGAASAAPDAGVPLVTRPAARRPLGRKVDEERVERVLQSLSTREKAGQLVLAYPQIGKETPVEVGGVLFVGNSLKNIAVARARISSS